MKIAINAMILGHEDTGVHTWTRGLIRALAHIDHENEYIVYYRRGADKPDVGDEPGENFRFVPAHIPVRNRMARIAWEQLMLPRKLKREGVDVLHCPAYVMPRRPGVPTVLTLHDLFALTHPKLCRRLNVVHYRRMIPISVQRAKVIHCTSHWTRMALSTQYPRSVRRVRVVYPGIDDIFRPQDPETIANFLNEKGLTEAPFLFVGNVEPKKNVSLLLKGVAELKKNGKLNRKLLLVGPANWPGIKLDAEIAELDLKDDIIRWGYVPRETLPLVYASALAFVFPSQAEGFGLPPLEAMACGTPVITSGLAGLAESVGQCAIIVADQEPASLADAMERVETWRPVRRMLTAAGLRRVRLFGWDVAARGLLELYREAAGKQTQPQQAQKS